MSELLMWAGYILLMVVLGGFLIWYITTGGGAE